MEKTKYNDFVYEDDSDDKIPMKAWFWIVVFVALGCIAFHMAWF